MRIETAEGVVVAARAREARHFWDRLRGLLGTARLKEDEALWIRGCRGIHMFGMKYSIDAVFISRDRRIVAAFPSCRPNRFGPVAMQADSVLELAEGTIRRLGLAENDALKIFE